MRDRRLPPGPATPPDSVDANQRERLCAALVAVSEEKGFDEARIEDLVRLSGVSRRDFYKRFQDKEDCLIATVRAIAEIANEGTPSVEEDPPGETVEEAIERAKASLSEFLELIHGQPAAARLFFCESYAGGPEALKAVDEAALNFVARIRRRLESIPGYSGLPDKLPHAIVGGYHKLIQSRLYRREEDSLPG
ncbi:MAG TPA: TetR/AcrR family transcriptional regulator, partial [Planctomycetaceae bacterium]